MEKIIVVGSGGHARSVVDSIESMGAYEIAGFVGPDLGSTYRGYRVICDDDGLAEVFASGVRAAAFGIGFMGGTDVRLPLFESMKAIGFEFPAIVDSSAAVARDASFGEGAFIGKCSVVNSAAVIGNLAIINSGAIVEHDCSVGDYAHVSVGAVLCGDVRIGAGVFVGAGATVIQSLAIGEGALIGAGSTVLRDVPAGGRALGLYA